VNTKDDDIKTQSSCSSFDEMEGAPEDLLYPEIIRRQPIHMVTFRKQFNDVIEK
jgi:hypothetical protein